MAAGTKGRMIDAFIRTNFYKTSNLPFFPVHCFALFSAVKFFCSNVIGGLQHRCLQACFNRHDSRFYQGCVRIKMLADPFAAGVCASEIERKSDQSSRVKDVSGGG